MTRKTFHGRHSNTMLARVSGISRHLRPLLLLCLIASSGIVRAAGETPSAATPSAVLESPHLKIELDRNTGRWSLWDKRSNIRWPTEGTCAWDQLQPSIADRFDDCQANDTQIVLWQKSPAVRITWELIDAGRSLRLTAEGLDQMRLLEELLVVSSKEQGHVIVPCREGLLISAQRGATFERSFGTSDYEGCHMNMLGLVKSGSALIVDWDDAYVTAELRGPRGGGQQFASADHAFSPSPIGVRVTLASAGPRRLEHRGHRISASGRTAWHGHYAAGQDSARSSRGTDGGGVQCQVMDLPCPPNE